MIALLIMGIGFAPDVSRRTVRVRKLYRYRGNRAMAIINKDEVKGKFEQGRGTIKDKLGELTGNRRMEAEGEAEHAKGETRETWGKFKRGVSNVVDSAADELNDAADDIND
jgi:uncharacterized protein YjbJ (UPF0337 family)